MAKRGGQEGNKNATKNKQWSETIRRVALRDRKKLEQMALALINKAADGDLPALREFGDRFEGRVPQGIEGTGKNGEIIVHISSSDKGVL